MPYVDTGNASLYYEIVDLIAVGLGVVEFLARAGPPHQREGRTGELSLGQQLAHERPAALCPPRCRQFTPVRSMRRLDRCKRTPFVTQ